MGTSNRSLYGFLVSLALLLLVQAQDQSGFISLDCGSPEDTNYIEPTTKIKYVSDASVMKRGVSESVDAEYIYAYQRQMKQLRSFPQGTRNCYNVSVVKGAKYLIRANFLYGNYDGLNTLPKFDLYIGNNLWVTVKFTDKGIDTMKEIIHIASSNEVHLCLINTGNGVPFISSLEFRTLPNDIYPTESGSLLLHRRLDAGSAVNRTYRFPYDVYDRPWSPFNTDEWTQISTNLTVDASGHKQHQPPSIVMKTASTPTNTSKPLYFWWDTTDSSIQYYVFIHLAELVQLKTNQSRGFNITHNGDLFYGPLIPKYLSTTTIFNTVPLKSADRHIFLVIPIENSTLPPIFNAFEVYTAKNISEFEADQGDVEAITHIKSTYEVKRDWEGDPCVPMDYPWSGVSCSNETAPRILSLNLSASGLTGKISSYISNLTMLQTLDLSNNNLTGRLPDFLSNLPQLKVLDLSYNDLTGSLPEFLAQLRHLETLNLDGNNLEGIVPEVLLQKSRDGTLNLSLNENSELCLSLPCKKKRKFSIPVLVSFPTALVLLTLLGLLIVTIRKSKHCAINSKVKRSLKSREYTYCEVVNITENFKTVIGEGGFGKVYLGSLKDKTFVAVKLLSPTSKQGYKEFQTEAKLLMIVHHRNLVSLVGFCDEGENKALIYEYMANGTVLKHISNGSTQVLNWKERLQIAVDAAQGLEYLHNGCKAPIIHRDMKTSNILLNEKMQAKIADFGLSRILASESASHLSTTPAGTFGYIDPEIHLSGKFTKKSDVYSFGIVLLELITGKPAIIKEEDYNVHILGWIKPLIEQGNMENIIDSRLLNGGFVDNGSAQKVVEVALWCTSSTSDQRPDMSCVLTKLTECLENVQSYEMCSYASFSSDSILSPR